MVTIRRIAAAGMISCAVCGFATSAKAVVLLDDSFADGLIADQSNLPGETEVFVGSPADVTEAGWVSLGTLDRPLGERKRD